MTQEEINAISAVSAYLIGELELGVEEKEELSEILAAIAERFENQPKEAKC